MEAIYEFDAERFRLGPLCKRNHSWNGLEQSLRYVISRGCVECEKSKSRLQSKAGKLAEANAKRRERFGRPSRAKDSNGRIQPVGITAIWAAIRKAGKCLSVAQLVMKEQRRYWKENPEAKRAHERQWAKASWWLQYQINPRLRLYTRQKARRRKALQRGSIGIHVKGSQVAKRFAKFGDCCAYCGDKDDLHIEHVIPISKGGTHVLSNVVPACRACNLSKRDKDAEAWYRAQPFFCEKRWRKILRVMGVRKGPATQLALL